MGDFLRMLLPWANWWNAIILSADIIIFLVFHNNYKKTHSRNLLTALPGLFTSLGILGTFGAICYSLAGISVDPEMASNVGMTIQEAATSSVGSLDIKRIISDLIPAFSTSIYGLVFAFFATSYTKILFANEDAQLLESLKYKDPEKAIEALDQHVLDLTKANEANNEKLTESIAAQSEILSKFVDSFVEEMQGCFTAMNSVIEERVTNFGTTQYTQSRELLEGLTKKLGDDTEKILSTHNESIKKIADTSSTELSAMKEALTTAVSDLKNDTVTGIEALSRQQHESLQKLAEDSLALHTQSIEEQNLFNKELLHTMSSSLTKTTSSIINGVGEHIVSLKKALSENLQQLEKAYEFISDKSASIVSNYEQASEAYRDAVQNAHNLNESVEKGINEANESLKAVGQTNDNVGKIIKLIEDKETNMEAIVMRIEALSSAIASLQRLESSLSRLTPAQ